jgi:hypothetical protein
VSGLDGSSWNCAYPNVQDAINSATGGDEIWVAEGVYKPASSTESIAFSGTKDGLKIYGGFQSGDNFGERNPEAKVTILSGDVGGTADDDPDGDNIVEDHFDINGENATHVVYLDGVTNGPITGSTVIDGFTITAGQADATSESGGGLYCDAGTFGTPSECSPTLRNVVFIGHQGGALFATAEDGTTSPTIVDAVFRSNDEGGGGGGVAIETINGGTANPTIVSSLFVDNESRGSTGGGGFAINVFSTGDTANPSIVNSVFVNNDAIRGGAIANRTSGGTTNLTIVNSTITGNVASSFFESEGGAIFNEGSVTVQNTILWGNSADDGGGEIHNDGDDGPADATLDHVIVEGGVGSVGGGGLKIENVNGGSVANSDGNLDQDPLFAALADPDGQDNTLATADDGLNVSPASPAVDNGDATLLPNDEADLDGDTNTSEDLPQDLTGALRNQDSGVNIGAYEAAASPSISGITDPVPYAGHPVLVTGRALAAGDVSYGGSNVPAALVSGDSLLARPSSGAEDGNTFSVSTAGGSATSATTTFERGQPYGPVQALSFDGTQSQHVDGQSVDLSGSTITMAAWIKPSQFTSGNADNINTIAGIEGNGSALLRIGDAGLAQDKPQFVLEVGGSTVKLDATTGLQADEWQHVAATYDGSTMRLYIDGRLDNTTSVSGTITANDVFRIGRSAGGRHFFGAMDQVRVWSTALSADQLRRRMHRTVATTDGAAGDRALAYRFDANSGDLAYDHTSDLQVGRLDEGSFESPPTRSVSGAPVGQESAFATDGAPSGGVGPSGGTLSVSGVSAGDTVQAYQYGTLSGTRSDADPGEVIAGSDGTRAAPTWGLSTIGSPSATVTIDYSNVDYVQSPSDSVVVLRRDGPGQPWGNATDWTHDPATQTFTATGPVKEGEYALKDGAIPPSVNDATPSTAYAGHPVVLTGTGFLDVSDVRYNGTSVEYSVVSTDSIRTRLPATATSNGTFTVVTSGGSNSSSTITLKTGPYAAEEALPFDPGGVVGPGPTPESFGAKDVHEEPGPGPSGPTTVAAGATTAELGLSGESFTIDLWFEVDNLDSPRPVFSVIGAGAEEGPDLKMELRVNDTGEIQFGFEGSTVDTDPIITENEWTHMAVVYEKGEQQVTIYQDGEQRAVETGVSPLSEGGSLGLGASLGGAFNGTMDQVRVWSGALSAAEIRTRMHRTIAPSDPVANERELAYRFDQVPAGTVYDHSGHFRHGTVNNPPPVLNPFSGARVGQESAVATDGSPAAVGPSGGTVAASSVAAGDTVQVYRFGTLGGTRDNDSPGELILGPSGTRSGLTWGVSSVGTVDGTVTFDYSDVALAQDPDDSVILIRRDGPGAPWENASGWTQDPAAQTFIKTGPVEEGQYALRDDPRTITDVTFDKQLPNEFKFSFTSGKQLSDIRVTVDGPSTPDAYTFNEADFSESGTGPYTYTLQTPPTFDRGTGTYTAVVDSAVASGRNWAAGEIGEKDFMAFTKVQNGAPAEVGEPVQFTIAVADGFASPTDTTFAVRKGGADAYQEIVLTKDAAASTPDTLRLTATVPGSVVTPRGVDYYAQFGRGDATLTVPAGGTAAATRNPLHLPVSFDDLSPPDSVKEDLFQEEVHRMVSIPAVPQTKLTTILENTYQAYDPSEWRLLQWNPSTDQYREFPDLDPSRFQPGRAFWLVTEQGMPFALGGGTTVDADSAQAVRLAPGWNQVGNPFGFAVPWDTVRTGSGFSEAELDGPYRRQDGRFQRGATLQPWRGYFVYNATSDADTLWIPPVGTQGAAAQSQRRATAKRGSRPGKSGSGYLLRVTARSTAGPSTATVGLRAGAKAGRDRYDAAKPPSVRPTPQVSVLQEVRGKSLPHARSVKPIGGSGQTWILRLRRPARGDAPSSVRVDWTAEGRLPEGQSRYVIDPSSETRVASGKRLSLDKGETRRLKVIVGTERYARKQSEAPLKEYETALRGNYPNPFDETTTLEYTLSREREVTMLVYNVLGQRVETLVDAQKSAGLHTVTWDGTNRYGDRVGSGVYFVRMEAGSTTETQKVVLVR